MAKSLGYKYTGRWYNIDECIHKITFFMFKIGTLILLRVTILCLFLVLEFERQRIANNTFQQLKLRIIHFKENI